MFRKRQRGFRFWWTTRGWPLFVLPALTWLFFFFLDKFWIRWSLLMNIVFYFEKLFVIEAINMTIVFLIFYKVPSLMDYVG